MKLGHLGTRGRLPAKSVDLAGKAGVFGGGAAADDPNLGVYKAIIVEQDGKAVQVWELHELPAPEPTVEERVDSLEQNVSDIIGGVTDD